MISADAQPPEYARDPRSSEDLFAAALAADPDQDDERYWRPIAALEHRLPQILPRVREMTVSPDERQRDTAATVLGQGWVGTKFAPSTCASLLLAMLSTETSDTVLASVIHALGHLHCDAAIGPVLALGRHQNPAVRWAVVTSLCAFEDERAVNMLIEASRDPDRDVRNWATFGIGSQIDTDTPAIREALVARLTDHDDEIRGEALVGLARRGDVRVVDSFLQECDALEPEILRSWSPIQDAAEAVILYARTSADLAWLPILSRLKELQIGAAVDLQEAIAQYADRSP